MWFGRTTRRAGFLVCWAVASVVTTASGQTLQQHFILTPPRIDWRANPDSPNSFLLAEVTVGTSDGSKVPFRYVGMSYATCGGCGDSRPPEFVVVSPSSGVTPSRVLIALNPNIGPYLPPTSYRVGVAFAKDGESCPACTAADLFLTFVPPAIPVISTVANAATQQSGPIAPGEIVWILGENLGTPPVSSQFDSAGFYPTSLGNTKVTFNGVEAALLHVSRTRIKAVVPFGIGRQKVEVVVNHWGRTAATTVPVNDTSPGIFTASETGTGQAAVSDGWGTAETPAARGTPVTLFGTGAGLWSEGGSIWPGAVPDGSIFLLATRPPVAPVSLTIGGRPARILYAGGAPFQSSGMIQINAIVPPDVGSGPQPVVLTIGQNSNSNQEVTVVVQ